MKAAATENVFIFADLYIFTTCLNTAAARQVFRIRVEFFKVCHFFYNLQYLFAWDLMYFIDLFYFLAAQRISKLVDRKANLTVFKENDLLCITSI
jgi:hypothetical protein